LYASAYRFLGPFDLLEAGFAQVLFPLLSSLGPASDSWETTRRRARRLYFLTTLPLVAVAVLVAPELLVAVFGEAFRPATPAARILLLSVIPGVLYWPDALAMMAAGFERVVLYLFIMSTAIDVVLVPTLSTPLGAAGAAWAWVAAELSLCIGLAVVRKGRLDPRHHGDPTS
ncbi:MAG: lipopolysaccharide biosynthesis protein, partial [Candidatus Dormibacteraceae bacterium]